jgi:prepilin-type processing-associated H-X9-DG protein
VLIAIALIWSTTADTRTASRRGLCKNNLKDIGLALHNYHEQYGCFPPAYVADEQGRPMHSWRVLLLPFLDQSPLYSEYHFDEPWNGPHNSTLADRIVDVYSCPSEDFEKGSPESHFTSYVAVVGPQTAWPGASSTRIRDFADGPAYIVHVVETANSGIHWMEPRDLNVVQMSPVINASAGQGISSRHPGGAQVLLGDGAARFLPDQMSPIWLQSILAINDGRAIEDVF